ncbi:MAG: MBOAT family protein, partial [Muribaculaceae bacterium]|nr:MBOAT family protein [Muribaculaceae bacterium]
MLIILTTVTSWGTALLSLNGHRRGWITLNVIINLCILVVFKYLDFFGRGLARLTAMWGWNIDSFTLDILLPVGISFYTFQAISYSIDVYRQHITPEQDLLTFATFIAFFPQLLAGPIERGRQLLPQISCHRRWDYSQAVDGAREMLWGLFKKVAVADTCGLYVDAIYSDRGSPPAILSVAAILFMLQIYGDFSGYCNMARGLSAMLGIRLSVNFRYPLFSRNPAEFWHRWHITLMTWFRDYVYIPLGGSRGGRLATCRNILAVFLLSGLWHGASLNYVVWGALWGIIMILARMSHQHRYHPASVPSGSASELLKIFATVYVATLVF